MPAFGDLFTPGDLSTLLLASVIGYILGALPLAHRVSRRKGVDIFLAGTGLAGSSNVLRTVGKVSALVVLMGDMAKGILAIFVAQMLGIEGPWLVVPASLAVVGHWNSVFTRFKGGDALATFGGSTLVVFEGYGLLVVVFAILVTVVSKKMPFPVPHASLFSVIASYTMIVLLSVLNYTDMKVGLAFSALAVIVFAHALLGHAMRRRVVGIPNDIAEAGRLLK